MEGGSSSRETGRRFSGRALKPTDLDLIREVVRDYPGLSRMELAHTVCELLGWRRESGRLKGRDCREFLEGLETEGLFELPEKRARRPLGSRTRVPVTAAGEPGPALSGDVGDIAPIVLDRVSTREQRGRWWGVSSSRVRPGGWRSGTCGSGGAKGRDGGISSASSTTAGS